MSMPTARPRPVRATPEPPLDLARATGGAFDWRPLLAFVALAYALSFAWTLPFAEAGRVVEKGAAWPTHVPALLGPMLAALAVTARYGGAPGLRELASRMFRWRIPARWWLVAVSPLLFLAVAVTVTAFGGGAPGVAAFGRISGAPAGLVATLVVAVLINGIGEETGWRGFALPQLQRRYPALVSALLVVPIWAVWHVPFFLVIATYRDFAPVGYVGFVFGLACGSIVLTWLYNRSGGSILACAVWHGTFNLGTATAGSSDAIAAIVSGAVTVQALALVAVELYRLRSGRSSVLAPRRLER